MLDQGSAVSREVNESPVAASLSSTSCGLNHSGQALGMRVSLSSVIYSMGFFYSI